MVAEDRGLPRQRVRESLRWAALLHFKARRPHTFAGLAGFIDCRACRSGLQRYKDGMDLSILRGLLAGATWTASRAGRQRMRPTLDCSYCLGQVPEMEAHILWDCPRWAEARDEWLPWVRSASTALLALGRLDQWPACMRNACLLPSWATEDVEVEAVDDFVHWLFGLGLAILSLRMRCERAEADAGRAGMLFPGAPKPRRGRSYPWEDLIGPLLRPTEDRLGL